MEDAYKVRGKVVVVGVHGGNNWTKGTLSVVNLWWTIKNLSIGKESWRTDVFFALCDSLVEKSHTWPFKFAQMQPVISI